MLRVLSVWQPWAWLIATGIKKIENRPWSTTRTGPLAIHASKTLDPDAVEYLEHRGIAVPAEYTFGAIIAITNLVGVHQFGGDCNIACHRWGNPVKNIWHWELAGTQAIDPIECRGWQNLWTPRTPDVAAELAAAASTFQGVS